MKKLLIIAAFLCVFVWMFSYDIKGMTYNDNNNVGYAVTNNKTTDLNGGVFHTKDLGYTNKLGFDYSQQVNVLTMKTNEDSKIVTWAAKDATNSGFTRKSVANIAKDYEKYHPGWTVVGGMNADQYYQYFGTALGQNGSDYFIPQPYYPMIADYEKWFSISATPYGTGNIVGFTNDGSEDQLLYYNAGWNYNPNASDKAKIAGLYLTIIRGQDKQRFLIEKFNESPGSGESSIFSPYYILGGKVPPLDVSGNNVFVIEDADLAYTSNSVTYVYKEDAKHNQNAFFGKGVITNKVTQASVGQGQFAINTNNQELVNALKAGDYVVAQYEYEGPLNDVESGIGFHKIMRVDNVDKPMTGAYNTKPYPRAMFGRKADGTIALVTVDMSSTDKSKSGANMEEANAILKHYGIVEGYQVDGGGSVTMVVKDGDKFKTVNAPSDGGDRNVLSALLFVVKDIGVETSIDQALDKIVFNVQILDKGLEKVFIKMNNQTIEVINGKVEFTNLTPNTKYKYEFLSVKGGVLTTSVVSSYVSTLKRRPVLSGVLITKDDENIIIKVNIDDPDGTIVRKNIEINGVSQSIIRGQVIFTNMTDVHFDDIKVKLSYDLYDGNGRQDLQTDDSKVQCDLIIFIGYIKNNIREKVKGIYE